MLLLAVLPASVPIAAAAEGKAAAAPGAHDGRNSAVVWLQVEGATGTIYEAPLVTTGHTVTTASGGTHHCDGTNNGANPTPGPTATGALDDGADAGGFTWDGTYSPSVDDYFVTRIATDTQTATQFWGILRNYDFTPVGGCQQRVQNNDRILFAYDAFNKAHVLKLTGPWAVKTGQPITVQVTDGKTGVPIPGATVGGQVTGPNGKATLVAPGPGVQRYKAERADSVRSNALYVVVFP